MQNQEVFFQFHAIQVAFPLPIRQVFDYSAPECLPAGGLQIGARVQAPFGSGQGQRSLVGVITGFTPSSGDVLAGLKKIVLVLDEFALLSATDIGNLFWASRYYHHPLGEVFASAFPVLLRKGQIAKKPAALCVYLTDQGRTALLPTRAVRQCLLLNWLRVRENASGIALQELSILAWDWRGTLKSLIKKGWVEIREQAQTSVQFNPKPLEPLPILNVAQQNATETIKKAMASYQAFLLDGVTGSGKTEVYLRLVEYALSLGLQSLVLVPEISLTPQLESRFRNRLGGASIVVLHSGLNERERALNWLAMQQGDARIMLGTRSAVFVPMHAPGLIIMDEEHDLSFRQQEGFRFSARDIAIVRARSLNIPILLGSATPSLESLDNVARRRYHSLSLPQRAGVAVKPTFQVLDIRGRVLHGGLSSTLTSRMTETIERGEQVLLFLNRRGYAPTLVCHACGWVGECPRCDVNLVVHEANRRLCCHRCGYEQLRIRRCPACNAEDLRALGLGTERVEQALRASFPQAHILRIDRDTTRGKGRLAKMLETVHDGSVDILLGTQMLAKGHHFPSVTLVGILDIDAGLTSPDFRALEYTAQLIVQVSGRAGREEKPGHVLLQTRYPDHPLLLKLLYEGYAAFSARLLEERKSAELPPYSYQALWRAEANEMEKAEALLSIVRDLAGQDSELLVLGPVRAPVQKQAGRYRCQLLFQATQRNLLHKKIDEVIAKLSAYPQARRARWSVDIEPVDFV